MAMAHSTSTRRARRASGSTTTRKAASATALPDGAPTPTRARSRGASTRPPQRPGGGLSKHVGAGGGVALAPAPAAPVGPPDSDSRRDVDLLVLRDDGPPQLFQNMRDGTFQDAAARTGLT